MLFFLFVCAETGAIDEEFKKIQETEDEINHAITGKKKKNKAIMKHLKLASKPKSFSHYKSTAIRIEQGGCPPSNNTTAADMRKIHDDINQQPHRPMTVACRHPGDIFESRNNSALEDPNQQHMG